MHGEISLTKRSTSDPFIFLTSYHSGSATKDFHVHQRMKTYRDDARNV